MASDDTEKKIPRTVSAQPRLHQRGAEIQAYGTVNHLVPLELEEPVRLGQRSTTRQRAASVVLERASGGCSTGKNESRSDGSCLGGTQEWHYQPRIHSLH